MIKTIKIAEPKIWAMAAMLSFAPIAAGTGVNAQSLQNKYNIYYLANDTLELNDNSNDKALILNKMHSIKDVEKYFNNVMQEFMVEDAWKGKTAGMNVIEYNKLASFCNVVVEHENSEIAEWAKNKLEEMEHLKNSAYNKTTLEKDLLKSDSKINKYVKKLDRIKQSVPMPSDFLSYILYREEYQTMNEHYNNEQKYCERDIAYYKALNKAELNNVLSSQSVKKLKAGQGKKVK